MLVTFVANRPTPNRYVAIDPRRVASVEGTPVGTMIQYHNDRIYYVDGNVQEVTAKLNAQLGCEVDTEPETPSEDLPRDWEDHHFGVLRNTTGKECCLAEWKARNRPDAIEQLIEKAKQEPHYVFVNPAKVAEIIDRLLMMTTETDPKPSYERCMKILQDLNQLCELLYV